MKNKLSFFPLILIPILFASCNKEKIQEFVRCDIDGVHYEFTDVADWQYQDSTGNKYFLTWCYKNSGDIDHDFLSVNYPVMSPGSYTLNTGPNGSPSGSGYTVIFNNTAGEFCVIHQGTIQVDEFEEQTSFTDPFKRFHGYFNFTMVNTETPDTFEITNGEFNFSEW